ncbi:MAG: sigma-54-dependent Fis family transcriptional regulator [Burkholderiaceae bacterium]|nr:MAG: sigma-54-dependent Fis family transcriptional regulator [Burkholderiaceae bacterium]
MSQTINLAEINSKNKVVNEESQNAKGLALNALWLDPFAPPSALHKKALHEASIELLSVSTLDELKKVLNKTNLVVIRIKENASLYDEVLELVNSVKLRLPIICRIDRSDFELGIQITQRGAFQVLASDCVKVEDWISLAEKVIEKQKNRNTYVFVDKESKKLLTLAEKVAEADVTTLITGPTGSGKEVLAKVLHDASSRYSRPFVSINCGAIPENLMEDLLFGHEKGAFTGAIKEHRGVFEQADTGTLFLDEIGELPPNLQTKLLRVLQERNVTRLGSNNQTKVDFRLIAATNKDLKKAIEHREFREDLYFRISTFRLSIAPLKDRPDDILPLATHIISKTGKSFVNLSDEAQENLLTYHWPGNVRELDNVIQRALVIRKGSTVTKEDLIFDDLPLEQLEQPAELSHSLGGKTESSFLSEDHDSVGSSSTTNPAESALNLDDAVRHSEYLTIQSAIRSTKNRNDAAKALGISPRTLRYKIAQLKNFEPKQFSFE